MHITNITRQDDAVLVDFDDDARLILDRYQYSCSADDSDDCDHLELAFDQLDEEDWR